MLNFHVKAKYIVRVTIRNQHLYSLHEAVIGKHVTNIWQNISHSKISFNLGEDFMEMDEKSLA